MAWLPVDRKAFSEGDASPCSVAAMSDDGRCESITDSQGSEVTVDGGFFLIDANFTYRHYLELVVGKKQADPSGCPSPTPALPPSRSSAREEAVEGRLSHVFASEPQIAFTYSV